MRDQQTGAVAVTLPHLVRGLVLLQGISDHAVAAKAGVSDGALVAHATRIPQHMMVWLRLVRALGAIIEVHAAQQRFRVMLPTLPPREIERSWQAWRRRRIVTVVNQQLHGSRPVSRSAAETAAISYASNEEARLRTRLAGLRPSDAPLPDEVSGLRSAVRVLAGRLGINAEELSLVAGLGLQAAQVAMKEDDGKLATFHRILGACQANIVLVVDGQAITIPPCPPGELHTDLRPARQDPDDKPLAKARLVLEPPNRSKISVEEILARYDHHESICEIARAAGVSRQRIHRLAMEHGRGKRRQIIADLRQLQGEALLVGALR
ncbi:hypothetical protein LBMAG53_25650 [Planctomycetota bacterium]|nr:hypothetical protein LBMAG53_25650 [Planctomycetota bacterium]